MFEVTYDKFNAIPIRTNANYIQKWITKLYNYCMVPLSLSTHIEEFV